MAKNITKEITDELNQKLQDEGCNFYFRFEEYSTDLSIGVIYPTFINKKFLDLNVCRISSDGYKFVREFLLTKGIDWIQETRAGGIIAHQYNNKTY